jgi:hypothetical protein
MSFDTGEMVRRFVDVPELAWRKNG